MNRPRVNLVQGALVRQLLLHSYCLLQQAHCPLAFSTAETSPTELEKTHFPKFNEFSVTTNAFHLPWELHLEHSCMETAGPEVTHQSPLVLHRHSLPLHCYLCTRRSVHWKPRPAMSWVGIRDSTTTLFSIHQSVHRMGWEFYHKRRNSERTLTRLQDDNKNWRVKSNPWPFCHYWSSRP